MSAFLAVLRLDLAETARARWFLVYCLVFGGIVAALFTFGLTQSRVMGFTGLSRAMVTYIQLVMAILPIFVLITTVRSVAGDREAGIFEYMLSLPVPLGAWYWGRLVGRFLVTFGPVALALGATLAWGAVQGVAVPWREVGVDLALMVSLTLCFLGLGFLISALARSSDVAQIAAFVVWLALICLLDLVLLGVLLQGRVPAETVLAVALANPLQVFRTASMLLFDPQLVLLGPSAYLILDQFGASGYLVWAVAYPAGLGLGAAALGFFVFRRGDLP